MHRILGKPLGLAALAALVLAGTAEAKVRDISGIYDVRFSQPACTERWSLRPDGSLLIESGEERLEGRWHIIGDKENDLALERTDQTTNGLPDCLGHTAKHPIPDNAISFYLNGAGDLVLTTTAKDKDTLRRYLGLARKTAN